MKRMRKATDAPQKRLRSDDRGSRQERAYKPPAKRSGREKSLRAVPLGEGRPNINKMKAELDGYWDVLLGRVMPPIDAGDLTLMECADAYCARALELNKIIHEAEREGFVTRGDAVYKFRTGELRDFIEMSKHAADLGSRRLTQEQLLFEMEKYGRESKGL